MTIARTLDLDELVDGQRFGGMALLITLALALAMISDGFDLAAMGYIAPELIKAWRLPPAAMVPAFSAGIIGMMIGGPLLGVLGDRYGRKRLVIAGLALIGIATLATMAVRGIADLIVLRFVTGLALGGVFPNVAALCAEVTPRRVRGRLLVIVTLGVPLGIALPGLVAAALVPQFGWGALLLVGGAAPLAMAVAIAAWVPESIKYLVERGDREAEARACARRLRPDLAIDEAAQIVLPAPGNVRRGSVRQLFSGQFRAVTPLLWICQSTNQMANFFSLTWLPMLLQAAGATTAQAGIAASLFAIGGLVAGGVLLLLIDRFGAVPLVALFVAGVPLVASLAWPDLGLFGHSIVIFGAGFCVTGIQIGLTALLGLVHPTPIRSVGTGWTQAAGRVGALGAPVVGGILLGMRMPIGLLPLAPAALLTVGALASIVLAIVCVRHFKGLHVDEFPLANAAASPG